MSTLDIVDDGGYNIVTVQADTVPAQLKNASAGTIAVINGNYALAAGLNISDALATENADGTAAQTYANIIAVRSGDENSPKNFRRVLKALEHRRRQAVHRRHLQRCCGRKLLVISPPLPEKCKKPPTTCRGLVHYWAALRA